VVLVDLVGRAVLEEITLDKKGFHYGSLSN
jgi:hypothetical protein